MYGPKAQSLQKYDARNNDGTPGPFRVTCPICRQFTRDHPCVGSIIVILIPVRSCSSKSLPKGHRRLLIGSRNILANSSVVCGVFKDVS